MEPENIMEFGFCNRYHAKISAAACERYKSKSFDGHLACHKCEGIIMDKNQVPLVAVKPGEPENENPTLGKAILKVLRRRDWSIAHLAKKCKSCTTRKLYYVVNDEGKASPELLAEIDGLLGTNFLKIYGDSAFVVSGKSLPSKKIINKIEALKTEVAEISTAEQVSVLLILKQVLDILEHGLKNGWDAGRSDG